MKNKLKFTNHMLRVLVILLVFVSCNKGRENTKEKIDNEMHDHSKMYYCPMHPEVTSDKPGICPKCGMDLELMPHTNSTDTLAALIQPTNRFVLSGLKAIVPSTGNHTGRIGALGYLTYNPDYVNTISARIAGRVEKMYVKYNFEKVTKGQKLLDLYSPELLTVQNEYLYILKTNDVSDEYSKASIRSKMINLGMNEKEISNIERTKQVNATIAIYATSNGHIHFVSENTDMVAHALRFPNSGNITDMSANTSVAELIREGDYIKKGEEIFTIADESSIWALFKVMPSDIGSIQTGDAVDVIINTTTYSGKVDFIEKSFDNTEDFYTLRVYMTCSDHSQFKIGTLIRGYISTKNNKDKNLWIPAASVVQLGKGNSAVFVKKQLGYEAHKIQTGKQSFEWIEVLSGLNATDSIAPVASYLVDSEAFISTDNN